MLALFNLLQRQCESLAFLSIFCLSLLFSLINVNGGAIASTLPDSLKGGQLYFLMDAQTKEVLLANDADQMMAPSSMTKLMTAYVVLDQVKKGNISLSNQCLIGKDAWKKSGSSMFLNYGDMVSVEDLLKGLLVVSGNDAAIALAQTVVPGGFQEFVALMNKAAKELGLKGSNFKNPHGLNEEGHYMTLRDLATLSARIYQDLPQYAHYFGISEFTYHNITQKNRNPLIKANYEGVLGGKTGYTGDGGYGVVGVVKRGNRNLIAVVNKARTPQIRAKMITDLLNYGFENYNKIVLFEKGRELSKVKVWLGKEGFISFVTKEEIAFNVEKDFDLDSIKVYVDYKDPIYAPIAQDKEVATLHVVLGDKGNYSYPLVAKSSVSKIGYIYRVIPIIKYKLKRLFD